MTASKAQALVPGRVVQDAGPAADADALDRLALWALRYSPVVAADPPDSLVIDILGTVHLHGSETALSAEIVARVSAVGFSARIGIGKSWGEATPWLASPPIPPPIPPP
jgi:protein ImuB